LGDGVENPAGRRGQAGENENEQEQEQEREQEGGHWRPDKESAGAPLDGRSGGDGRYVDAC
jgi:hypothetical protein